MLAHHHLTIRRVGNTVQVMRGKASENGLQTTTRHHMPYRKEQVVIWCVDLEMSGDDVRTIARQFAERLLSE